ncbi:hypothetical protein PT974_04071 [Cladobotryum mycophilum]|uniref:Uncharacterized protein n=1 Tax=Cladobotryum mycophilum TaxID=491253 RepID=A0ABR0SU40_9HYPO
MHNNTPSNDSWVVVNQGMQSMSPQYQQSDSVVFVPSPCSGISGVDGSFILSTSPSDNMNGAPVPTTMPYHGGMLAPEDQYQDLSFANITEAELGTLAGIWDYSNLNLDYITSYPES